MDRKEILRLEIYLRTTFRNEGLSLRAPPGADEASLHLGPHALGTLSKDVDEGEVAYQLTMILTGPPDMRACETALRGVFRNEAINIKARGKVTDSVEVNMGQDFVGVLYADGKDRHQFQMTILDIDLEGL